MRKNYFIFTLLIIGIVFSGAAFADDFFERVSGGGEFAIGLNTPIGPAPDGKEFEYGKIPTFRVGLGGEYHFTDCTDLQLKVLYHYAGLSYTDSDKKIKTDCITIDVPVLFKYTLTGTDNKNSCGRFGIFAGPDFSFVLSNPKDNDKNDRYSNDEKEDNNIKTGDLHAIGLEFGIEYSAVRIKGLRIGCSVLFDFANFHDGAELSTRRACIMSSIGYWL